MLAHTEFAKAQPSTAILKLFRSAGRMVHDKDRVKLHLLSRCQAKNSLQQICAILFLVPDPVWDESTGGDQNLDKIVVIETTMLNATVEHAGKQSFEEGCDAMYAWRPSWARISGWLADLRIGTPIASALTTMNSPTAEGCAAGSFVYTATAPATPRLNLFSVDTPSFNPEIWLSVAVTCLNENSIAKPYAQPCNGKNTNASETMAVQPTCTYACTRFSRAQNTRRGTMNAPNTARERLAPLCLRRPRSPTPV